MREIKFRAKQIVGELPNGEELYGKFVCGNLVKHKDGVCRILEPINDAFINYKVVPNTIGQFTGLYDKNDKEIYEGDIVGWKDDNLLYAVIFRKGMFYASVDVEDCNEEIYGGFPLCTLASQGGKGIEIVGNIYDNPELKKK